MVLTADVIHCVAIQKLIYKIQSYFSVYKDLFSWSAKYQILL